MPIKSEAQTQQRRNSLKLRDSVTTTANDSDEKKGDDDNDDDGNESANEDSILFDHALAVVNKQPKNRCEY